VIGARNASITSSSSAGARRPDRKANPPANSPACDAAVYPGGASAASGISSVTVEPSPSVLATSIVAP